MFFLYILLTVKFRVLDTKPLSGHPSDFYILAYDDCFTSEVNIRCFHTTVSSSFMIFFIVCVCVCVYIIEKNYRNK